MNETQTEPKAAATAVGARRCVSAGSASRFFETHEHRETRLSGGLRDERERGEREHSIRQPTCRERVARGLIQGNVCTLTICRLGVTEAT